MKRIKNIIAIVGIVVMAVILTGNPQPSESAPVKRYDADWVFCEGSQPPMYRNVCKPGTTYIGCTDGPCAIKLPVVVIRPT